MIKCHKKAVHDQDRQILARLGCGDCPVESNLLVLIASIIRNYQGIISIFELSVTS